ncbi:glycosyltransferase 87 family protein [Cryobacterium sp. SO2]|uniref:glycosyltransferase 87 family protein n=1 Tax=Cryobacterium sp. SO2 TaxID=1897060 RepID=UPI00223E1E15|nr:glycosyltransferase 87 family protein [Cryobacterium sp. SO2]WEO78211.1 glycosyltransferase 87 family protein [Cryobacterium sp. SO2]
MPESPPPARPAVTPASRSLLRRPVTLWAGFVLVHVVLVALNLSGIGWPLGDVERVYLGWAEGTVSGAVRLGIDTDFVYPILALAPILAALVFGAPLYALTWLGLVTLLNGVAFGVLIGRRPGRAAAAAAWWWLAFLLLLGPVGLARIDSVTAPLAILGLLWLRTRPFWGAVLLSVATWVKVWPVAAIIALAVASKRRWQVIGAFAGTSAIIIGVAMLAGSGLTILSFVTEQTDRGLQIEAPVASWWLWSSALGFPGTVVYYDQEILTYQVIGAGTDAAIALMTPLLVLCVAAVLLLGWRAQRAGASVDVLFPPLLLALVLTLISINKVGSPQFMTWLAAPIILGLVSWPRAWRGPAAVALVVAGLTQLVYPYFYNGLLATTPTMVFVLSLRNLLELVLLVWMGVRVWKLGTATPVPGADRHRPILKE